MNFFVFFFIFFILKVHFFSGPPKKFILKFCPHQKFIFFSFRKNVRSKNLFFVYLLVSKFQVQIPYPKPGLNPKSLGFRILVFGWFKLSQVKLSNQPQQILARFPFATNETIVKIYV